MSNSSVENGALVLFSGGQDSTTCLAWALNNYSLVETIGFDYRQRNRIELDCRKRVRQHFETSFPQWKERLGADHLIDLGVLGDISDCALTRDVEIEMQKNGLPNTFVPGRNLIFLMFAATIAYRRNLSVIIGGMCEVDYSNYPDCRNESIEALQKALNLGMASHFILEMPLMYKNKAQTWELANQIGSQALVDIIREHSHTCYLGQRDQRHEWGYGCGKCPACELRARGYQNFIENRI